MRYLLFLFFLLQLVSPVSLSSNSLMEICDNAIDDDGDGLIDLNDNNCVCEIASLSLIPNNSFEEYFSCPFEHSQVNLLKEWMQPFPASTDYHNTCGDFSFELLEPFPDGNGVVGFFSGTDALNEFLGVCLREPMKKDSTYLVKFNVGFVDRSLSPRLEFTFYGSSQCSPFSNHSVDCPLDIDGWSKIESVFVSTNGDDPNWIEVTLEIQPTMDVNSLMLGGPCDFDIPYEGYHFVDNIRLAEKRNFDFELIDLGSYCNSDFVFSIVSKSDFSYQWYKEGIALIGESRSELSQMYGEGNYQVRITNKLTQDCRVSEDIEFFIPFYESEDEINFCEDDSIIYHTKTIYEEGVYEVELTSSEGCDSIVTLHAFAQPSEIDTIHGQIIPGGTYSFGFQDFTEEGEYVIDRLTSFGCDRTVIVIVEELRAYIPNIFSPNGDGRNDFFGVHTQNNDVITPEISIFDRWGNLIFSGEEWDGRRDNRIVDPGVYVYVIKLEVSGQEAMFHGSVTVIQ